LTSENEWGMYPGVPQLAICQLDRFSDLGAVVNRVFIWNGRHKRSATPRGEPLDGRCRLSRLTREQATRISELTGASGRGASIGVYLGLFTEIVVNTGR